MCALRTMVIATALAASVSAGSAQSLTNGPNGNQPNSLSSNNPASGINANKPSRARTQGSGASLLHGHKRHQRH